MGNYSFVISLIKDLEAFTARYGQGYINKAEFGNFLVHQYKIQTLPSLENLKFYGREMGSKFINTISNFITTNNRYKMNYIKIALENSVFETYDEFAFVLSLVYVGDYTPSKLIERHIQAKPTGTEIIRRLIRKDLVIEVPSEKDKRSKWLKVTEKGKEEFFKTMKRVTKVSEIMMSPLTEEEKIQFLEILQKLDNAHRTVFNSNKKYSLEELMEHFSIC